MYGRWRAAAAESPFAAHRQYFLIEHEDLGYAGWQRTELA